MCHSAVLRVSTCFAHRTTLLVLLSILGKFLTCNCQSVFNGVGSNFDDGFNRNNAGRRPGPPVRKDRDDKVHDSIIEERIQRERPCRTLFIRNIKASHNET
jgi:hypothetical protein